MHAFAALADPVRARIVEMLAGDDLPAGDIAAAFAISRPAVSRHLSVLLKSRLVSVRGEAQRRIYSLDPDGLDAADAWIADVRQAWRRRSEPPPNALEEETDEPWRRLPRRIPL